MSNNDEAAATPAVSHEPPSLPASPLPKRTKVIDPTPSALSAVSAAQDSGIATPTPSNMASNPAASLLPSALSTSSSSAAPKLEVQFLSPKGKAPTRGSAFAAGHDIYSAEDVVVPARGRAKVATDISISVPAGTYGRIAPRSGLAAKHGIDTLAGVIDADYRGPVGILLANLSDEDFQIKEGDRIAQLILERIVIPEVVVVEKLAESVRGAGGFGSTGGFGAV